MKRLLQAALADPEARDTDLVLQYQAPVAPVAPFPDGNQRKAPARLQVRLNPETSEIERVLWRYFRGVPNRTRSFEAGRLLRALLKEDVQAPSHAWKRAIEHITSSYLPPPLPERSKRALLEGARATPAPNPQP